MQGNLKQIALPEVLQFISMGKSTGTLTVRDAQNQETTLLILHGRIINSSALERQRRLGDLLVHRGILKRSVLAHALTIQRTREPDRKIGEILLERDLIQEEQIREVLRLQLEEEIWNLFALSEGDFKFEQKGANDLGEMLVQIDIEPLLLEGSRRQDEWQRIMAVLPNDRMIVAIVLPQRDGEFVKPKLIAPEWRVLSQINGRFPIRALINRTGMSRFDVYKILCELKERGLVQILEPEVKDDSMLDKIEALARESSSSTPLPASMGVGGLFSRFTSSAKKEDKRITFTTPIGALAYIINQMADRFLNTRELKASTRDYSLVRQLWNDLLVSFTKADLIVIQNYHVNTDRFEEFMKLFEFSSAVQDCYEDSLEALLQLLDGIYRIYAQRTGDRVAVKLMRELLEEIGPRINYTYASDVKLDERIQMVLRLAA